MAKMTREEKQAAQAAEIRKNNLESWFKSFEIRKSLKLMSMADFGSYRFVPESTTPEMAHMISEVAREVLNLSRDIEREMDRLTDDMNRLRDRIAFEGPAGAFRWAENIVARRLDIDTKAVKIQTSLELGEQLARAAGIVVQEFEDKVEYAWMQQEQRLHIESDGSRDYVRIDGVDISSHTTFLDAIEALKEESEKIAKAEQEKAREAYQAAKAQAVKA